MNSEKTKTAWPKSKQPKTQFLMKKENIVRDKIEFRCVNVRVIMLPKNMNSFFTFREVRSVKFSLQRKNMRRFPEIGSRRSGHSCFSARWPGVPCLQAPGRRVPCIYSDQRRGHTSRGCGAMFILTFLPTVLK